MCQLTFINLGSPELNKEYLLVQSTVNTLTKHRDGFGYFTPSTGVIKTKTCPNNFINLGIYLNKIVTPEPVMAHVREASFTGGRKLIESKYAHPFEAEKLVLAHNGLLEFKDYKRMGEEKYKDIIDSQIFLSRLEEVYNNIPLPEALTLAMQEFYGKFAFLIYDKTTRNYFIARGESAKLFFYKIEELNGFIINTERNDLEQGFLLFNNFFQLRYGNELKYDMKNIIELSKNSIFYINDKGFIKVGEIEENTRVVSTFPNYYAPYYQNYKRKRSCNDVEGEELPSEACLTINRFLTKYDISLEYLDEIVYHLLGVSLLSCSEDDINLLVYVLLPEIEKLTKDNVIKEWLKIKEDDLDCYKDVDLHNKYNIKFPYMLVENVKELRDIRHSIEHKNLPTIFFTT